MYAQTYGASAAFAGDATAHFGRAEASVGLSDAPTQEAPPMDFPSCALIT